MIIFFNYDAVAGDDTGAAVSMVTSVDEGFPIGSFISAETIVEIPSFVTALIQKWGLLITRRF